jgi:urea carboxylase
MPHSTRFLPWLELGNALFTQVQSGVTTYSLVSNYRVTGIPDRVTCRLTGNVTKGGVVTGLFTTLLVANRGEIAVRVLRTARRIGLRTVAVYSDADRDSSHVRLADEAVRIGAASARDSYLRGDHIISVASSTGAGAIHPGYGFLSEDPRFAGAVEGAGLVFVGPTVDQLTMFGAKHTARTLAQQVGVPMLAGTGLLADADAAVAAAVEIGFPVMAKATGGGGGIGMRICRTEAELREAFASVARLASANFASSGVFLERYVESARHIEVQIFGDGQGQIVALGDRDCSLQRRHQKVIEEAPAAMLPSTVREWITSSAVSLAESVRYRSAGTVEFVYDVDRQEAYFLEMNTRLQVEHPVTEEVFGVDLVEWMLRLAQGDSPIADLGGTTPAGVGHAVEARIYAEDPAHDHRPSAGLLTRVEFDDAVRVDTWIETGTEIGTSYDPLLAKVIASGLDRTEALDRLATALQATRVDGIETNLPLLRAAVADARFRMAEHNTDTLSGVIVDDPRIEVLRAGRMTTVQDWPGRTGLWNVGVPPSGPMDDRSFRLGNLALGNAEGVPGLECTIDGPTMRFSRETKVCVTGAPTVVTIDGKPFDQWQVLTVPAGGILEVGSAVGPGLRTYLLFEGGLDLPTYLGSTATFTLGGFGGMGGRALRTGDVLRCAELSVATGNNQPAAMAEHSIPEMGTHWQIAVAEGPHAAPDFFTPSDMVAFYNADWRVHFNSARTGVRLEGPKPQWARPDGGDAGLHPSNIHDTPYAIGAVDFTGDLPVLLGPDGPSLGGFVCPATIVTGERWKLGQLRPGDTVRFWPVDENVAASLRGSPLSSTRQKPARTSGFDGSLTDNGVLLRREATDTGPAVSYRRSGDDNLLIEYGPMALDLSLRMRVHALATRIAEADLTGVIELTPGIRSLQLHTDPDLLPVAKALEIVRSIEDELPATAELVVPSRTVHLPLSWDDPATREAIARYMAGVRDDAPWCPWNIEFIRRANGLPSVDDVRQIVFDASYLVLGLGDVYLGAPVATPLDPRHRLVTTKYNPARTWTPENAVGIGGAYLCIYGMEGPGGYQFVGRTVQVWSRFRQTGPFEPGSPWLLRFFDQIRWYPVGADELLDLRADLAAGRMDLDISEGEFSFAGHQRFLDANAESIAAFRRTQSAAFGAEREAWAAAGEFDPRPEAIPSPPSAEVVAPAGGSIIEAPFVANVWRVEVREGETVRAGQPLALLEAMKMETAILAPYDAVVVQLLATPGLHVVGGSPLAVLVPSTTTNLDQPASLGGIR